MTDSDRFGWLGKPARPPIATSAVLRVLWRMQAPTRIVTAALYDHPVGTELRVYLEPESADDLLNSHVERVDIGVLETRAAALRAILLEKGQMQRPSIEDVWPRIWCRTCEAICPLVVVPLVDPLDHDASDLVCGICSSIVATLHGPEGRT